MKGDNYFTARFVVSDGHCYRSIRHLPHSHVQTCFIPNSRSVNHPRVGARPPRVPGLDLVLESQIRRRRPSRCGKAVRALIG